MAAYDQLKQVKEVNKQKLFGLPNVVGVGVGYKESRGAKTDEMGVIVMVSQKLPKAALTTQDLVPKNMDGARTDVIEVGYLRALQTRTDRWRPAPPGVSIGHYQITAGTFGAVVRDRSTGAQLILSNNHVLANSNNANPGDPVLQPGPADGGTTRNDTIGQLERFCPIQFDTEPGSDCSIANSYTRFGNFIAELLGSRYRLTTFISNPQATNLVDAAVARPADDSLILEEILEIGPVAGTKPASLGMSVRKSGRTTEFTTGEVNVLDASVSISYGANLTATFEGQIVTSAMSQGGDSGSLLVDGSENKAVGLLFAGSNQSTIHNPIQAVLDCLEVDL